MKMTKEKLEKILQDHTKWLAGRGGARANLNDADLRDADLSRADLIWANLSDADLSRANLSDADLICADLSRADLRHANLSGVNLRGAKLPPFNIPQECELTVWKKGSDGLIKLLIPHDAKRTGSLVGRKCRAEFAKVLWTETGEPIPGKYKGDCIYTPGEMVYPDSYNDDPRVECTHGIHFFLTREEAEQW